MSSELAQLIQEPAGGPNHGRQSPTERGATTRWLPLGVDEWQAAEFMRGGGFTVVTNGGGERQRAGMTAHRGVLHTEEHVDVEAVIAVVERELGFTTKEVRSVYARQANGGPLPRDLRELRERLDARLLALSREGSNLLLLARVLGLKIKPGSNGGGATCDAVERALARARAKENV